MPDAFGVGPPELLTVPGPTPCPIRHWSTDAVAPAQRLDYWVGAISEGFLSMGADAMRPGFNGSLTSVPFGAIALNQVQADPQRVWRTRREIAQNADRNCYLIGDLNSAWRVRQDGHVATVQHGDFVLVDSRRPYEFAFDEGVRCVSLELPLHWVTQWIAAPEAHVARPFRRGAEGGWGDALASFARALRPAVGAAPPLPAPLIVDQLGALLAMACGGPAGQAPADRSGLPERAMDVIRQRLAEPGLTGADVARSLGVSVRTLHRHLAARQSTFAGLLLAERMRVARQMLTSPHLARVSSAEIGRRVGLLDPSHFIRLCKRAHGVTPAQLRPR